MRALSRVLPVRFGLGIVTVFSFAVGSAVSDSELRAAIYYVSTGGDDDNDGSSWTTAFETIKKAAKRAKSGDWVYVSGGTYTDDIVVNGAQQSTEPVRFVATSGVTVAAQWKVF